MNNLLTHLYKNRNFLSLKLFRAIIKKKKVSRSIIIALDLGTTTGFATCDLLGNITSGTASFKTEDLKVAACLSYVLNDGLPI